MISAVALVFSNPPRRCWEVNLGLSAWKADALPLNSSLLYSEICIKLLAFICVNATNHHPLPCCGSPLTGVHERT